MLRISDFDYEISHDLVAQLPITKRDESRLLILNKNSGQIEHKQFFQIVDYLQKGDLLILNDTKVIPARLMGRKKSGGQVEILMLSEIADFKWNVLLKSSSRLKEGAEVEFSQSKMIGTIIVSAGHGQYTMSFRKDTGQFSTQKEFWDVLNRTGRPPLPPYIKREKSEDRFDAADRERYQTVFAKKTGAIAAPTAGLHFTPALIEKIRNKGVEVAFVTLHVGIGTFRPIKVQDCCDHVMESEYYEVSKEAADSIKLAKKEGRRIIGVGTTSCRVLETIGSNGNINPCSGWTDLYIYSPYKFKTVDAIITNFHQPKSTLLLLVSAFAGRENILKSYEIAKNNGYRFFSYGDCMMIV